MPLELKGTLKPGEADRRYYMIRVQVDGRRVVASSGTRNKQDAIKKESALIAALRANPKMTQADIVAAVSGTGSPRHKRAAIKSEGVTLREAFDRCLRSPELWGAIKGRIHYERGADEACDYFGADLPLDCLDADLIAKYVTHLSEHEVHRKGGKKEKRSGSTVNFYLSVLRSLLNTVALGRWEKCPTMFPPVPSVPKRTQREFYLSPEDEEAMLNALDALDAIPTKAREGRARKRDAYRYRQLFLMLLEAGLRVREGLGLRWSDIRLPPQGTPYDDPFQGSITLGRADEIKRGKRRTVPMTPTLRQLMESLRDRPVGPFSDLTYSRARDLWARAREAVGIHDRDCVIHSTRHTCASRLLEAEVNLMEVKTWLGHSSVKTTEKYIHLANKQLVGAAAKMSRLRKPSAD